MPKDSHSKKSAKRASPSSDDGPPNGMPNLLLKLLEACAKHKRRHDHDRESNDKNEGNEAGQSEWCHNELKSFARVLPRMEGSIVVTDKHCDEYHFGAGGEKEIESSGSKGGLSLKQEINDEDAVGHLCALYRAIARGAFCSHAVDYLFVDDSSNNEMDDERDAFAKDIGIAKGIIPRITKLLEFVALDPVKIALSPLKQTPNKHALLGEAVKLYHEEEYLGSTIASLLDLLQDEKWRFAAAYDLIHLSNDLSVIDDSNALFSPPISSVKDGDSEEESGTKKIRVHVFTEVARLLRKSSTGNIENESSMDNVIQIQSRRSLLALQFGVWTALQHFTPHVTSGDVQMSRNPEPAVSARRQSNKLKLVNSLLSSSRSTALVLPRRPSSQEPKFLGWSYSTFDAMIHTLIMKRIKLAVVGLFTHITTWDDSFSPGLHDFGSLSLSPSIDLALLSIESAKCHLQWCQPSLSERPDNSQKRENTRSPAQELEHDLNSMCSWAVANFLALAVLFPDKGSAPKNDIWSHCFPYLLDCIPLLTDSSNECSHLCRVVLRSIHATSSILGYLDASGSSNVSSFIQQFRNRCLVRGYYSHLFELVNEPSESISGTAVSIIVFLLESYLDAQSNNGNNSSENLVETACSSALGTFEAYDSNDNEVNSDKDNDTPLARLGNKRRKLEPSQDDKRPGSLGSSIQPIFTYAVSHALVDAQNIIAMLANGNKLIPISVGPEVVSLFSESDTLLFRGVTGILRILISMRSRLLGAGMGFSSTDQVITLLFTSTKRVSEALVKQKDGNDKLIHIEPNLFNSALSSIVSVGLHACCVQKGSSTNDLAAREALSYCAIASLKMINPDRETEVDDNESLTIRATTNTRRMCGGICCRLASMIGIRARPHSDICLCRLVSEINGRLENECGAFAFNDTLSLECRCIFLAFFCPVASDSGQYEPTLSSFRCILANLNLSKCPVVLNAALLGLPNLFLSLSTRQEGTEAASAKYLARLLDSFCFEDLVIKYTNSDIERVKTSAMLALARLSKIYAASSLLASREYDASESHQYSNASSYLWQELNPAINGMHTVILRLMSVDGSFSSARLRAFSHPVFSNISSVPFCLTKSDTPRQWMAHLVYLQAFLDLVPESILRSCNTLDFFCDKRHYDVYEKIAKGENLASSHMPIPAWLFLLPFLSQDTCTQTSASNFFGRSLLNDKCKVFSAFFIPKSEMEANLNQISYGTAKSAVNRMFSEVDYLMGLCGLGGLFSRESGKASNTANAGICIGIFTSLCQWSPLNTAIGGLVFERSLLALIRIWIASSGGHAFDLEYSSVDPTCNSSLASNTFDRLNEIFRRNENYPDSSKSTEHLRQHVNSIMPKIFSEFFLPPTQQTISAKTRYRLLLVFIGTFILPQSAIRSLRTENTLEVPSLFEIMVFIDSMYPSILVQMIKDEDHEAIQMCAAFRMYLLSEAKKLNKEEKRIQKKGITELIIGTRQESQRSGSNSRSLVPGVSISTTKLIENAKLLCIKTDVISHVLPQLLLHPSRAPLRFFTAKVCQSELNYPDILREIGLSVLKTLVWELGGDDLEEDKDEEMFSSSAIESSSPKRKDVRLALAKGFLLKEGSEPSKVEHLLMLPSQDSTADNELCESTAGRWIAPNFMFLLVNIVLHQWAKRSEREKFRVIKCLRKMLYFLPPSDSPQYMPQIMTAINNAISSTVIPGKTETQISKLRFIAVATLFDYVRIVTSHDASEIGENLTTIVVALFPLFKDGEFSDSENGLARRHSVQMLEWLATGEINEKLPLYFGEIPFLPFTEDLKNVRKLLFEKGVQLDDVRLMSQKTGPEGASLELKFYKRMNILSQLVVSHENKNVREVVIRHMTDLIKANRDLFQSLILNEELSSMHFLTVVNDSSSSNTAPDDEARSNGGLVTKLLVRLLSRSVSETDRDIRDAIAACLGEIGAIDPKRLGQNGLKQFVANSAGSDDSSEWRRVNPPWKTSVTEYQLLLVTRHLVSGLKSAPATLDQHKISFAIQELLRILDSQLGGQNRSQMTPLLKEKLQDADVQNIVEPFWSTNYKQVDTMAAKSPPFFSKSNSYFTWLSSLCRYLVTQSYSNKKSPWSNFFHACRSAIRSQAGIKVAEFLLPLLILDAICFGGKFDENVIVDEFLQVLSLEADDSEKSAGSLMKLKEREKAVNVVFTAIDVLRNWLEKEIELRHQRSRGRSQRTTRHVTDEGDSWPVSESLKKIECLLERIPLSSCAIAASKVGMHARALQFLEMEGRRRALMNGGDNKKSHDECMGVPKFLKSHLLDDIDLHLIQTLLGQLNDFDTMVFVAEKSHQTDLTKRIAEEAAEREMYEDWEGAFRAYEQLLDSRLNDGSRSLPNSTMENTKINAQKGLLRCLLKLGRLDSVLNQAYGMSKQSASDGNSAQLLPSAAEAAWRLGKWSTLDSLVHNLNELTFDADGRYQLSFGRTMHSLHSKTHQSFVSCLRDSRECIMSSLSSAARDGYTRSYPHLLELHALREVEYLSTIFFEDQSSFQKSFIDAVSSDQWADRLDLSTPDVTGSNAILNTRLALSRMANDPTVEGLIWLDIGKVARKGGLYQVAEHSLTQANVSFCKTLIERPSLDNPRPSSAREYIGIVKLQVAKLKHSIGESTTALKLIEDDIPSSVFLMDEVQLQKYISIETDESGETIARRILQATEWMVCDGLKSSSEIKGRYQTVLKLAPSWERAHFNYAKFLDSLAKEEHINMSKEQRTKLNASAVSARDFDACQEYLLGSVQHYGMALQLGQKHVYQALPRLLAIWLEFTSLETEEAHADDNNNDCSGESKLRENQELMNRIIKSFVSKIPEHLFYTALPQLISRVVHKNRETAENVALILRTVLAKYPRQSMWSCGWLRFSKSKEKKIAGDDIFRGAQKIVGRTKEGQQVQEVLKASKNLFQFFISLAQFMPKEHASSVRMKVPGFDTELKNFIPPIQAALSLSPGALDRSVTTDVFPSFVPRMRAFNPQLKVMQSKAKPKKVSIFAVPSTVAQRDKLPSDERSVAEDAGEMHFLVKQEVKGDLRKDSRVQDLNNVINRIFASRKGSSGPDSRRRKLHLQLRTFSVVCLAEDCGILEWVPHTESLRSVITETYNPQFAPDSVHRHGSRITNFSDANLRGTFIKCQEVYFKKGDLDLATKKFDELILNQYLPVMYWWFVQNFSNSHSWYEARTNFTLSTAVWSAVGHIIGLGDRHSENILIDTSNGECVHVDFDCIFDKGLLLPRPEVIPFRLTPNMLDAFGPTGADGMYTGALTESMRTLRKNRDTLMSVLEPFLNDPVINFRSKSQQKSKEDKDAKTAMESIAKIEGRLDGEYNLTNPNKKKVKNKNGPSIAEPAHITKLSVEGQVQKMIMEATSHENLVQVYVGWMPWI